VNGSLQLAPAKINLSLFVGPARADGRHELVTLFQSVDLADELTIVPAEPATADEVLCEGVAGPNLVAEALSALRDAGWDAPPVRVTIAKRIPVAAGMGGGSADAAAMLRHAPRLAPIGAGAVEAIAARLGADVPAQLRPGAALGTGAGEVVEPVPDLPAHGVLVLPQSFALSTPDVYREADRLGLPRTGDRIAELTAELRGWLQDPLGPPPARLIANDLQLAALSLRPDISMALERALDVDADQAIVCGSGPTAIGIFWGYDGIDRARVAASRLAAIHPGVTTAAPVLRGVAGSTPND
jgi:4-diphosphocytidyl-2-C-methyl-D-erythritol kinase